MATDLSSWPLVKFGDVVRNVDTHERSPLANGLERYIGLEHLDPESLHIKRWGLIAEGTSFTRKFTAGQVLFGKRRAYQRKAAVAKFDGLCSGDILVFEPSDNRLLPELLPFIVQSEGFVQHALGTSAGSLSPRTKWRDLAAYEFALPPKEEQRRMAEILWAAEETIENYLLAQQALEICQKTITTNLTTKGLDHANFSQTELGQIPNAWQIIELTRMADIAYGLTVNTSRRKMNNEKPYLRVANVLRGKLDLSDLKTIGCTSEDTERFMLQYEDVLVVEGHANVDEIGRAALWRGEVDCCLHQNHILRVRCKNGLNPEYLLAFLNSPMGRVYFKKHAKSTSGLNTINSTVLKKILIPLPPLKEQVSIVRILRNFEKQHQEFEVHLAKLFDLKKSLLKELLLEN